MDEETVDTYEETSEESSEGAYDEGSAELSQSLPSQSIEQVKVPVEYNGKVYNLTLDQAAALAKKSLGLAETAHSAKQYKSQLEAMKKEMEDMDVVENLRKKGYTSAQIIEHLTDSYGRIIEEESETPEQKELKTLKKYKDEQEKRSKEVQTKAQQMREQVEVEKYTKSISEELAKELDTADLPRHPFFAKMVIQEMMSAQTVGYSMGVKEAVKLAEVTVKETLENFVSSLSVTQLQNLLGKKYKAVREASVAEFKQSTPKPYAPTITSNTQSGKQPKKMSVTDYFRNL